jgi:hypothetical protein
MADTYTWHIAQLERKISDGVVYTAHWTVTGTREVTSGDELTASSYGSIGFGEPDPSNFTPYENLKESQIVGWVLAALGDEQVETICKGLTAQLTDKKKPVNGVGIPW